MQVGSRKDLANVVPTIWSDIALLMKSTTAARSPLLRKFIVKLSQRIGHTCLPHRSSSWHYQVCLFFKLNSSVCLLLLCSCLLNLCPGFLCVPFNAIFTLGPISTWVVINITLLHKGKLISSNDDGNLSMIHSVAPVLLRLEHKPYHVDKVAWLISLGDTKRGLSQTNQRTSTLYYVPACIYLIYTILSYRYIQVVNTR